MQGFWILRHLWQHNKRTEALKYCIKQEIVQLSTENLFPPHFLHSFTLFIILEIEFLGALKMATADSLGKSSSQGERQMKGSAAPHYSFLPYLTPCRL